MDKRIFLDKKEYKKLYDLLKSTWKKTDKEMDELLDGIPIKELIYNGWWDLRMNLFNEREFVDDISANIDFMLLEDNKEVSSTYLEGKELEERRKLVNYLDSSYLVMSNIGFIIEGETVRAYAFDYTKGVYSEFILGYNKEDNSLNERGNSFNKEDKEKLRDILKRNTKFLINEIKERNKEE